MASQSTRGRLGNSGGKKTMAELLSTGRHWEALRAHWYQQSGQKKMSQECLGRQRHFEMELDALLKEMG